MRFLHLSDIHFIESPKPRELRERLIIFLENNYRKSPIDYVFITGDFRHGKKQKYNELARKETVDFINDIMEATKVPVERLVIVPGNHDCNREIPLRSKTIGKLRKDFVTTNNNLEVEDIKNLRLGFDFFRDLKLDIYIRI